MPQPPSLAAWLLTRGLGPSHEAVAGDLEEEYHDHVAAYGPRRAAWLYTGAVLRLVPVLRFYDLIWQSVMLKNYFVVAVRTLRKHKGFTAINVLGLAVSMSVCLLIIALIRDQRSYDRFHEKANRIYRVTSTVEESFGRFRMATSPGPLGAALRADAPDVEAVVRLTRLGGNATVAERTLELGGLYAEASFFDVFDFDLALGDAATALAEPFSLVLTPEAARRFFDDANPLGQVVHRDGVGDFTVTGVLADADRKTHLVFDALGSFATLDAIGETNLDDWNVASIYYTYFVLADGGSADAVAAWSADRAVRRHTNANRPVPELDVQALTGINLGPEMGNQIGAPMPAVTAYFFSALALLLMGIAIFNYVSLTVVRSLKRAREIGIRKVMGARRPQIVRQFLGEAVLVSILALVLASVLLVWLLPGFNSLHGFQEDLDIGGLSVDLWRDGGLYLAFLVFAVGVGVAAGLYPAFKMASYVPTRVLKGLGSVQGFSGLVLRKGLVVFQFTVAIVAIVVTTVVYRQLTLAMEADYGFDEGQLLTVDLDDVPYETLRNEWMRLPGVVDVAAVSALPSAGSKYWTDIQSEGMAEPALIQFFAVDEHFIDQFRLERLAGRDFSEAYSTGDQEPIMLTARALGLLGFSAPEDAVGQVVTFDTYPEPHTATVIGVVGDFYARGFERGYTPVVLRHLPERLHHAVVRLRPDGVSGTLAALEATWRAVAPTVAFSYAFYDDQLARQYLFMQDVIKLFGLVAGFVIFIACLGLLGMANYTVETRRKEVGIRKVLGADVRSVVLLLSRDYVRLLLVAVALGGALAWLLGTAILQRFPNRINLNGWVLLAGILPTVALALLTIGSQTFRAGATDPVDTLRQE